MQTLEALTTQINSIKDLQSVVKTMKALAMVSIRQYETAVTALAEYNRTVEMGLQILLRNRYFSEQPVMLPNDVSNHKSNGTLGVIIFGSDHGLCGQFNEQIVSYALEQLKELQIKPENCTIAAVGARLIPYLETAKQSIYKQFSLPNSVAGITSMVQEILLMIEQWRFPQEEKLRASLRGTYGVCTHPGDEQLGRPAEGVHGVPSAASKRPSPTGISPRGRHFIPSHIDRIILVYNKSFSAASYRPQNLQLLPMNTEWLQGLEQQPWHSEGLPTFTMDWEQLFSTLIRQYLFVALYRAFAESLASENASRLASMQAAQKNIEERLTELNAQYRHQRQSSITSELLDIVSGFEALNQDSQ